MAVNDYLIVVRNMWEPFVDFLFSEWTLSDTDLAHVKNLISKKLNTKYYKDAEKFIKNRNGKSVVIDTDYADIINEFEEYFNFYYSLPFDVVSFKLQPILLDKYNRSALYDADENIVDINNTPFVYIIKCGDAIKIGKSRKLIARLYSLQSSNAEYLEVIRLIRLENYTEAGKLERELHKKYKKYKLQGEWFSEELLNEL